MPTTLLRNWTLVSLRPLGQHSSARRAAAAQGARCIAVSTLRLPALPWDALTTAALKAPVRVFTSPAAVRAVQAHPAFPAGATRCDVAVGQGTARALRRAGSPAPRVPAQQDSGGVLALPLWQARKGRVGVLTAPGGRGLLAPGLAKLGWQVQESHVYRREASVPRAATLAALPTHARVGWLVSSAEAFDALWAAASPAQRAMFVRQCFAVPSARLAAHLRQAGCVWVVQAEAPQPRALVAAVVGAASRKLPA